MIAPLENVLKMSTPAPQKSYFKAHVCRPDGLRCQPLSLRKVISKAMFVDLIAL